MPSALLLVLLMSAATPALAIYKCESEGHASYSELPCTEGTATRIRQPAATDYQAAQRQLAQEKRQLQVIETQRRTEETRIEKERLRRFKESESRRKRCAVLEQRARWAHEDASRSNMKQRERMQRKAQRATERQELECGR